MATNSHMVGLGNQHAAPEISGALSGIWTKIRTSMKGSLRAFQTGRMMSVLAGMSDAQLTEIGIQRSDIPQYAEKLMAHED